MDNLTHSLVGLTAARTGLERVSAGATIVCILAANSPDVDIVILLTGDRWSFLQYHRGITHAIVGVVLLALLLPLLVYGIDRLWARVRRHKPKTKLRGLLLVSLIVTATHPLLDWTNSYGIRFFLPWSQKWSYGDLVFIVDPYLWLILGGAVLLTLRAGERWRTRTGYVAFALVLMYWSLLGFAHSRALTQGSVQAAQMATTNGEVLSRLAAMPKLANPFRWDCVFETDRATYRFDVGLMEDNNASQTVVRYAKPTGQLAEAMHAVSQERPARVFLGFARFPVAHLADPGCATQTLVQLADLRYTEPGRSRGTFSLELPVECPGTSDEGGR
jgi:inner membrane protein